MKIELKKENHGLEPKYVYRLYVDGARVETFYDSPKGIKEAEEAFELLKLQENMFNPLEQPEIIKSYNS